MYRVTESLKKARDNGIKIKLNTVIIKGSNDHEISDLVKFKEEAAATPGSESSTIHSATQPVSGAPQNSVHSGIGESQGGHSSSAQTGPQATHGNQDTL